MRKLKKLRSAVQAKELAVQDKLRQLTESIEAVNAMKILTKSQASTINTLTDEVHVLENSIAVLEGRLRCVHATSEDRLYEFQKAQEIISETSHKIVNLERTIEWYKRIYNMNLKDRQRIANAHYEDMEMCKLNCIKWKLIAAAVTVMGSVGIALVAL